MALDERYIVASDLEQYFVDKDSGLPLAGGTLTFYRDISRNTQKKVFQLSGSPPNYTYTAMPNPITLSSVGTVQNAGGDNEVIYYFPYTTDPLTGQLILDLYCIKVKDSNGVEQFTREAWPNVTASNDPTNEPFPIQNQISNPQFTQILINDGMSTTYAVQSATNQVFSFAPDWDFVISGTGNVIIQRIAIAGNSNVVTSPPYVLDVNVGSGITSCFLRQRMNTNSGLWASQISSQSIFLAGSLIAQNQGSGTTGIDMFYDESSGGSPILILSESVSTTFATISGATAAEIPASTNTDLGANGYIDIYLSFLTSSHVRISSIQVIPTLSSAGADLVQYDINSSNREQALMGDYFIPRVSAKETPNILTGWDFSLNPMQFGSSGNISTSAGYICDQTIAVRGSTGNVTFTRDTLTNGLEFTTAGTNDAFLLATYLSGQQAKKILGTKLSFNINSFKGSAGNAVTVRAYLFRGNSSAVIPTLPNFIGTISTDGTFTKNNIAGQGLNWTEVARSGLGTATATLGTATVNTDLNTTNFDYGFTGWQVIDSTEIGNTDKLCMIITYGYADSGTAIFLASGNLVQGDIPSRPSPQTPDEVLRECEYYYESTYPAGSLPNTSITNGSIIVPMTGTFEGSPSNRGRLFAKHFSLNWRVPKPISTPTMSFFTTIAGNAGNVAGAIFAGNVLITSGNLTMTDGANFTYLVNRSTKGCVFNPAIGTFLLSASTTDINIDAFIQFHLVIDTRLGILHT